MKKIFLNKFFILCFFILIMTGALFLCFLPKKVSERAILKGSIYQITAKEKEKIEKLFVKANDKVKKGDRLFKLDSSKLENKNKEYLCTLSVFEKNVSRAKKHVEETLEKYLTAKKNDDEKYLDYLTQLDAKQRYYDIKEALLNKRRQKIKNIQDEIDRKTIFSPCCGTIIAQNYAVGETIKKDEAVLSILETKDLWVEALVDESLLDKVHINDEVSIVFVAYPSQSLKGKIAAIQPIVEKEKNDERGTNSVEITFNNENVLKQMLLKPGMSGKVYFKRK